jgi:hypothetical protein
MKPECAAAPSGKLLYYISERDGFACIWARRLNPRTKMPMGEPFAVHHQHSGCFFLNTPTGFGGVRVTHDRLFWIVAEGTGDVFLLKLPAE